MSLERTINHEISQISNELSQDLVEYPKHCEINQFVSNILKLNYKNEQSDKILEISIYNFILYENKNFKASIAKKFLSTFNKIKKYQISSKILKILTLKFKTFSDEDICLLLKIILFLNDLKLIDYKSIFQYCEVVDFLEFSFPAIQSFKCDPIRLFYTYSNLFHVCILFIPLIKVENKQKTFLDKIVDFFDSGNKVNDFHVLLTLSSEFYFGIMSEKPKINEFLDFKENEENRELLNLFNHNKVPRFCIIYGAILKSYENISSYLNNVVSYILEFGDCCFTTDLFNFESYFAEKCLSLVFRRSLENSKDGIFKLDFNEGNFMRILHFYINGILSNSTDIHYAYRNSFITFIEFAQKFGGIGAIDEMFSFLAVNACVDGVFSSKSLKLYYLIFGFVQNFGVDYALKQMPDLINNLIRNMAEGKFRAKILHIYSHLIGSSFSFGAKDESLAQWLKAWLYPILNKNNYVNNCIIYQMISVWNSSVSLIIDHFNVQTINTELSEFLHSEEIYPNVLPLIFIILKKVKGFILSEDVINKIRVYLYSTFEEASVESLNILCLCEKDPADCFRNIIQFLESQPISQAQHIRESLLKIISSVFLKFYKSKNCEHNNFKELVERFFSLCILASNRTYFGRSYIAWKSLEIILHIAHSQSNKTHNNIIFNMFFKSKNLYYFIERLNSAFEHESSISSWILENIPPEYIHLLSKKLLQDSFNYGIQLIDNHKIENEKGAALFMKFLSNQKYNDLKEIISFKSDFSDSKSLMIFFLISLLDERYKKLDYINANSFTSHAIVSCLRACALKLEEKSRADIYVLISEKLIIYMQNLMKIILIISPEGFSIKNLYSANDQLDLFDKMAEKEIRSTSLSFMNFVWRFTKECCLFLCDSGVYLLENKNFDHLELIFKIHELFENILINAHHVGIYESTIDVFKIFAKQAWRENIFKTQFTDSFRNTTNMLLISSKSPPKIISTRRGAGLPLYFEVSLKITDVNKNSP